MKSYRRGGDRGHWVLGCLLGVTGCTRDPWALPEVPEAPAGAAIAGPQGAAHGEEAASGWSYRGDRGPEQWAGLNPDWKSCAAPNQSPVDLPLDGLTEDAPAQQELPPEMEFLKGAELTPQFADLPLELNSDGRLLTLVGAAAQGLSVAGRLARLDSIVIHRPAEHTLGGTPVDLELVFWLETPQNGRLALSVLFRSGERNAALTPLITRLPPAGIYEHKFLGATLRVPELLPPGAQLLAYLGSETTPPCSGQIPRLALARVLELGPDQLEALKKASPETSQRPLQPLGERKVTVLSLASPSPPTATAPSTDSPSGRAADAPTPASKVPPSRSSTANKP